MKLLYCPSCGDIFNLQRYTKTCTCGKVVGRYVNSQDAEVNGEGVSLAIGNGSFDKAIFMAIAHPEQGDIRRLGGEWIQRPGAFMAWARPHEGEANPHTKINKEVS